MSPVETQTNPKLLNGQKSSKTTTTSPQSAATVNTKVTSPNVSPNAITSGLTVRDTIQKDDNQFLQPLDKVFN